MTTTIFVCDTCRFSKADRVGPGGRTGGELLAAKIESIAAEDEEFEIRRHSCLMGCDRHCNVAVTSAGKLTYVLGMFTPTDASAEAIIDYARHYSDSPNGVVPYKRWPQGVKGHFVARIPPLGALNAE